jgi:AraC family transcriptional regulator
MTEPLESMFDAHRPFHNPRPVRRNPDRARRHYAEDAKLLLHERFREKLRLDDVARALHVSTYHLCRLFKEETGMTLHAYLRKLRLRDALERVAGGKTDLGTLALELGFSSHSHFTTAFRKEFGLSPRSAKQLTPREAAEMMRSLGL